MTAIGGFFDILLPEQSFSYHDGAAALTNGRACIRTMLVNQAMSRCYLPNYTCDAIYHPFELEQVPYQTYDIDENFEPTRLPELAGDEFFFYINYFGLKSATVKRLLRRYGDQLIIDNTHAFFTKRVEDCWSFTVARKHFGVPDGAFLYAPKAISVDYPRFEHFAIEHSLERLRGNPQSAFKAFQAYEASLNCDLRRISLVSEKLLSVVDRDAVIAARRQNFEVLSEALSSINSLSPTLAPQDVPFAYPFLPARSIPPEQLHAEQIYIPSLWKDALARPQVTTPIERNLAQSLLPLPVDQRYSASNMAELAEKLRALL